MKPCNQCGKCCINYSDGGLSATAEELGLWEAMRPDISRYVRNGLIWMDPDSGEQLTRCPWLIEEQQASRSVYSCAIYFDRPDDCRHYPVTVEQMAKDDCEMLELKDLTDLNQAQKHLDNLMIDSRPAQSK